MFKEQLKAIDNFSDGLITLELIFFPKDLLSAITFC